VVLAAVSRCRGTQRRARWRRASVPATPTVGSVLGLGGPRETVVTAWLGRRALAMAADLVGDGVVSVALAGGVDALTRICFAPNT
jgi:3-oxoacyl-(acyl-carrier-protein) synthase